MFTVDSMYIFARSTQDQPALSPPPGIQPDFVHPANRDSLILGVSGACVAISTLFVILRSYTRIVVIKKRGWEDYLLWIAWLLSVVYFLMAPLGISIGAGLHQWNVNQATYMEFAKRSNITDIFYSPVMCMVKLAILLQLQSVFAPNRNKLYWFIFVLSGITVAFYFACTLVRTFACVPREKIWNPDIEGRCINSAAAIIGSAVLNVVSDFVILITPLARIWRLQMTTKKKLAVSTVFLTGLFGCIASIMRLVASVNLLQTGDITYYLIEVGLWCDAEITSAIVCCCLPVLPQFWRKHFMPWCSSLRSRLASSLTRARTTNGTVSYAQETSDTSRLEPARGRKKNNTYVELDERTSRGSDEELGKEAAQWAR